MTHKYIPRPINVDEITLPEEIDEIVEALAKNVHDVWAKSRIDEGWSYGENRDDIAKTHPGIVEYDELSESEKDYDRNTALYTLKVLQKLGYTITRNK